MTTISCLPPEVITHVMRFLSVSDRKEAALVCKLWYHASLDPILQDDIIVKFVVPERGTFTANFVQRKLSHLALAEWDSTNGSIATILRTCSAVYEDLKTVSLKGCDISEATLVDLLSRCPKLVELDLSRCNSVFLSGKLLEKQNSINSLKQSLSNVEILDLSCLRHLSDLSFKRLVSIMKNIESISIASSNIMFGSGEYGINGNSAVFQYDTFLNFVQERAGKIRRIDLSYLPIREQNLEKLACIEGLFLEEIVLKGCSELNDRALATLAKKQSSLQLLDISGCKELGENKNLIRIFVENLPKLRTLNARKCVLISQSGMKHLAGLGSLRSLDLSECVRLFDDDLISGLCVETARLHSLNLRCCEALKDKFVSRLCRTNQNLVYLDLSFCIKLTDVSVQEISKTLRGLRSLKLASCREITDLGLLGYIPENGVIKHVTSLCHDHDTCRCQRPPESKIFRKPTGLKAQHLSNISEAQAKLEAGEDTCMLSNLVNLQTLDLSSCMRLTDLGVGEAINFCGLRSLSLNMVKDLTDFALDVVAKHNPSLEEVNVKGCVKLTDASVVALAVHCRRLARLNMSLCDLLTDNSLMTLSVKSKKLIHLDVSFCQGLTVEGIKHLESHLPRVKVLCRPLLF